MYNYVYIYYYLDPMTTAELLSFGRQITPSSFVGIADLQKSPKKALAWPGLKVIMNNAKPQWVYLSLSEWEDLMEDFDMMNSPTYKQNIAESRASGVVDASEVWKHL